MNWGELFSTFLVNLASIGIVALALKLFFSESIKGTIHNYFQKNYDEFKNRMDKDMEIHRSHIRLYEFIYPKKLAALSELYEFRENVLPDNTPDMEWGEACEEIARSFVPFGKTTKGLIIKYGSILPNKVIDDLRSAMFACQNGTFLDGGEANAHADRFFNNLENAISMLRKDMEIQVV